MTDAAATPGPNAPDLRAQALVGSYERAGYARIAAADPAAGRAVPRPLRRGHPQAHVSHHRSARRANCACGPISLFRSRATIWPRPPPASRQGFCYLGAVFRHRGDAPGGISAGRHRIVRPPGQGGGRCRNARARAGSDRALWLAAPDIRIGDVGAVLGSDRRARSGAGLEAAADQGLQPQVLACA